jgi:hypothetical protein
LVEHLLLFEFQLLLVRKVLPLTTSAHSEVLAEGNRAYLTIFYDANYFALGKGMFFASNLYVAHVSRHAEWYKYYKVVPVKQTLAFGCNSFYRDALKER